MLQLVLFDLPNLRPRPEKAHELRTAAISERTS
jgi:hypothetical protein